MRGRIGVAAAVTAAIASATATAALDRGVAPAQARGRTPLRVTLPAPTGGHAVGERQLRLVDPSRRDPWLPARPYRELMVSIWYPAHDVAGHSRAPYMLPRAAAHFAHTEAVSSYDIPRGTIDWGAVRTDARLDAPVDRGRWPVVLYSPGLGDPRTFDTATVEDLASRGYVVVTIDHPGDSSEVQFPDGRLVDGGPLRRAVLGARSRAGADAALRKALAVRVADTRFVLDELTSPRFPLAGSIDSHDIGMFGQSGGGFETLETMRRDPRVRAGADLDGIVGIDEDDAGPGLSPLARDGLDRPFLLMGSATNDHYTSTSWASLWRHSDGWHRDLHMTGARHASYTDAESIVGQAGRRLPPSATANIGWISPAEAVAAQRHYVAAFFDRWLRHRATDTFDRPDPRLPQLAPVR